MLKTVERLTLIAALDNRKINLALIKNYDNDTLHTCCNRLEANKIPSESYQDCDSIQDALIRDELFSVYLLKFISAGLPKDVINTQVAKMHSCDESVTEYPVNRLISSMVLTAYQKDVFYDYLKFFSHLPINKEQKEATVNNLAVYRKNSNLPVNELPDSERKLLTESYLSKSGYIPPVSINKILPMLTQNPELTDIIRFFYAKNISVTLMPEHYLSMNQSPCAMLTKLKEISMALGDNLYAFRSLTRLWVENNCPLYDLQVLSQKLKDMTDEQIDSVLDDRSSYINLIFGNKIKSIPLSEIPSYKEDILIYAITEKKHNFIRLIEGNFQAFANLGPHSILFRREFYANHVNINSMNIKNLSDCGKLNAKDMLFEELGQSRNYTFDEIKALCGQPMQYYRLYGSLDNPRVDIRLIALKQLINQMLLHSITEDAHIDKLAEAFNKKLFSVWCEKDFSHISGVKHLDVIKMLIHQTEIEKFIPQMKSRMDALLVLRNWEIAGKYNSIDEMRGDLLKIDSAWRKLVQNMELNDGFLKTNQERVIEFLCRDGAGITNTYYNELSNPARQKAFTRIVKAELMGEFNTLKYFADDLRKEIDFPIAETQKAYWTENSGLTEGHFIIKEHDDFFSTMIMGTAPQRTCLSYIDGQYNECLLSNFDSNKKILYAHKDGNIVGRAIIRLTKSRYSLPEESGGDSTSLSFVDVETLDKTTLTKSKENEGEQLTLFLERFYTATLSPESERRVVSMFIKLAEEKAAQMGAALVLSNSYQGYIAPDYAATMLHVYISRSKGGSQYLDSLNGSAKVSDEGGYRSNNFYIRKDDNV